MSENESLCAENEIMLHQEKMNIVIEQAEYNLFSMLKPKIFKDGKQWCVLYGNNIQDGIAGFGDTPYLAILNWNSQWQSK